MRMTSFAPDDTGLLLAHVRHGQAAFAPFCERSSQPRFSVVACMAPLKAEAVQQ